MLRRRYRNPIEIKVQCGVFLHYDRMEIISEDGLYLLITIVVRSSSSFNITLLNRNGVYAMSVFADAPPFGTYTPTWLQKHIIALTRRQDDNWLGRRIAFAARKIALLYSQSPLDTEVFGNRMRLYPINNVCEKRILFTPQFFDAEERTLLAERIHDHYTFIDVGANVGAYALFVAALAGRGAKILAVEPQPVIFERLVYNISANPDGCIKAVACALADREGDVTLFIDGNNHGESSVKTMATTDSVNNSVKVPAKTLLTLLQEENIDHIDGLKIDIEGAEDLVLIPFFRDAPPSLWPKLLIIENGVGRWQTDCIEVAKTHGYKHLSSTRLNIVLEYDHITG